ncbi:hypothetical protein HELRODRAFT_182208 [Helobdella robusta]|uniref:Uncharacterized protein n=1 Tax=Helobdella robusta TaxID=6412 RepID=T1FHX5_HELRO|nr:hypothetical protein HELRODRAFT_182208 [Helobdella robusta]ESN91132.1 hypothetical protein HELRODRAFT_182208 [Helobdella robusta]
MANGTQLRLGRKKIQRNHVKDRVLWRSMLANYSLKRTTAKRFQTAVTAPELRFAVTAPELRLRIKNSQNSADFSDFVCAVYSGCGFKNRKNSGSILPMHGTSKSLSADIQLPVPTNDVELESWEVWGVDAKTSTNPSANRTQANFHNGSHYHLSSTGGQNKGSNRKDSGDPEIDIDYFQELQLEPEIRKTQKIIVRKKEENVPSNRLAMVSDIPTISNDLGTLEDVDCGGWPEETMEDISGDAVRDKRRSERERKLMEHQQKKLERDALRKNKIVSTKLS